MELPGWLDVAATLVVTFGLLYMLLLLARRSWLSIQGGLFDCGMRRAGSTRWRMGLARYSGEVLEWYRTWQPLPRPSRTFVRGQAALYGLRASTPEESSLAYATARILELEVAAEPPERWELAMNEGSAVAMVSWLESAPPGQVGYRRRLDG